MDKDVIYPTMVIRSQAETIELQEKEIERLNNEIKTLLKENSNKEKVIIKQNNIIDELEKYHIKSMENLENTEDFKYVGTNHIKILYEEHKRTLDKLKELKEGK